ncbi:MAG: hypothetical protein HOG49_33020 [Candidatus Scalindua sp.]|jgi:hypothetical protein|nr:hypothetical protein [Candidatus Scalindua sp.]
MTTLKGRNLLLAAILSLFLGPLGFLYVGWTFMVSGLIITAIFALVLSIINLPTPSLFEYLQLVIFSYHAYKLATIRNLVANDPMTTMEDIKQFKSFGFSVIAMTSVLMTLAQYYSLVVGFYMAYISFANGKILIGVLIVIFGISAIMWVLTSIFGFISSVLMVIFKVDDAYFN